MTIDEFAERYIRPATYALMIQRGVETGLSADEAEIFAQWAEAHPIEAAELLWSGCGE